MQKRSEPTALEPWEQRMQEQAKEDRAKETLGVARITHQGGVLQVDGKNVEGNQIPLITLDYIFTKEYYEEKFTPGAHATPVCYAFGDSDKGLVAHPEAPAKQNLKPDGTSPCTGCPHNAFGTADVGRGKACKDTRRLLVIAPLMKDGKPTVDATYVQRVEKRQISIPPASLKNFGVYLTTLQDLTKYGNLREAVTLVKPQPRAKGGHELTFSFLRALTGEELKMLQPLQAGARDLLASPFPVIEAEKAEEPAKPVKGQKRR